MPCQFDEAVLDRRRPERVAGTQERRRLERARPTIRPACVRVGRSNTLGCTATSNIGSDLWQRHMFRNPNHTLTTYHVSLNTSILLRRIHHQIGQSYATCVTVTSQCSSPRVVAASAIATWGVPPILTRRQGSDGSRDTCAVVPTSRRETSPANAPTDPLLSAIGWRFCSGPFEGIYRIPNS